MKEELMAHIFTEEMKCHKKLSIQSVLLQDLQERYIKAHLFDMK
jgi:hypothetical protein